MLSPPPLFNNASGTSALEAYLSSVSTLSWEKDVGLDVGADDKNRVEVAVVVAAVVLVDAFTRLSKKCLLLIFERIILNTVSVIV